MSLRLCVLWSGEAARQSPPPHSPTVLPLVFNFKTIKANVANKVNLMHRLKIDNYYQNIQALWKSVNLRLNSHFFRHSLYSFEGLLCRWNDLIGWK